MAISATITVNEREVTATLEGYDRVVLTDEHVLGEGTWNGRSIQDCPVTLGDDAYDAMDDALQCEIDRRIEILRDEANQAGDSTMADICCDALGTHNVLALRACIVAIVDAEAMND